jgi:hypothetical protein
MTKFSKNGGVHDNGEGFKKFNLVREASDKNYTNLAGVSPNSKTSKESPLTSLNGEELEMLTQLFSSFHDMDIDDDEFLKYCNETLEILKEIVPQGASMSSIQVDVNFPQIRKMEERFKQFFSLETNPVISMVKSVSLKLFEGYEKLRGIPFLVLSTLVFHTLWHMKHENSKCVCSRCKRIDKMLMIFFIIVLVESISSTLRIAINLDIPKSDDEISQFIKDLFFNISSLITDQKTSFKIDQVDVAESQGFLQDDFSKITALKDLTALIFSFFIGARPNASFYSLFEHHLKFGDKIDKNGKVLMDKLCYGLSAIMDELFGQNDFSRFLISDKLPSRMVLIFAEKVNDFITDCKSGRRLNEQYNNEVFEEFKKEGSILLKKTEKFSHDYKVIEQILRELDNVKETRSMIFKSLNGSRIEPVFVYVSGPPGIGKSNLIDRLMHIVGELTLPSEWLNEHHENPDRFTFNLPPGKFWDGYNYKTWSLKIDDILQKRDVASSETSEPHQIISMINTSSFMLDMAQCESKNTTYFRSPFVYATSNLEDVTQVIQSINQPEAFKRRMHFAIKAKLKPLYAAHDGKVNSNKLPTMEVVTPYGNAQETVYPIDAWDFTVTRNGDDWKIPMTFNDIVKEIVLEHKRHVKNFYANKIANDIMSRDLRKQFQELRINVQSNKYRDTIEKNDSIFERFMLSEPQSGLQMFDMYSNSDYESVNEATVATFSEYIEERAGLIITDKKKRFTNFCEVLDIKIQQGLVQAIDEAYVMTVLDPIYFNDIIGMIDGIFSWTDDKTAINFFTVLYHKCLNYMAALDMEFQYDKNDKKIDKHEDLREYFVPLFKGLLADHVDFMTGKRGCLFNSLFRPLVEFNNFIRKYINVNIFTCFREFIINIYSSRVLTCIAIFMAPYLAKLINFVGKILYKIFSGVTGFFFPEMDEDEEPPDMEKKNNKHVGHKVTKKTLSDFGNNFDLPESQGFKFNGVDIDSLPNISSSVYGKANNTSDIIGTIHNKYFFILYLSYMKDGKNILVRLGHTVNIKGNFFMMPMHFLYQLNVIFNDKNTDGEIIFMSALKKVAYRVNALDFIRGRVTNNSSMDKDMCLVKVEQAPRSSVGAYRFLLKDADVSRLIRLGKFPVSLLTSYLDDDPKHDLLVIKEISTYAQFESNITPVRSNWDEHRSLYGLKDNFKYDARVGKGDCGSLLFYTGSSFENRNILGFHVAGTDVKGYSSMITQELIDSLISSELPIYKCEEEIPTMERLEFAEISHFAKVDTKHDRNIIADSQSGIIPTFKLLRAPARCMYSSITKSVLHGKLPFPYNKVSTKPARLKDFEKNGVIISPSKLALGRYGKEPSCIPLSIMYAARDDYEMYLMNNYNNKNTPKRSVIPLEEALHGFDSVKPINSSTSAGYPFNLPGVKDIKKLYYEKGGKENFSDEEFLEIKKMVGEAILAILRGERPAFFYCDSLKDEKVSEEKSDIGKSRLFSAAQFIMLILFRMYFGSFMSFFIDNKIENGSAIGVNPFSDDWDIIARSLLANAKSMDDECIIAGDFSSFDGHGQPLFYNMILDIINNWYGKDKVEDNKIRTFLFMEIVNSRHIFDGLIYYWFCSLASGNPLTALLNTMYNCLVVRVAYIYSGLKISTFSKNVKNISCGDDITISVHPDAREKFNELVMPSLMEKAGMVYTLETKDKAAVKPFRKITEVEFLKRSFSFDRSRNRWIAPRRMESIMEQLNWTKKGLLRYKITADMIGDVLRELSLYDKDTYDKLYDHLINLKNTLLSNVVCDVPIYREWSIARSEALKHEFEF